MIEAGFPSIHRVDDRKEEFYSTFKIQPKLAGTYILLL
jgi:hypothetical protein